MIGEFVRDSATKTLENIGLLVFIIVFLLFDWLSRVRLPHLIKEDPKVWQQLFKAFLEVTGLVFLILLAVLFVSGKKENREAYAAVFLFVSLFWNAVQIKVMKELDFWPLLKAIVSGTVVDMEAVREYADKFLGYKGRVKKEFEEANEALNRKAASAGPATRHATTLMFSGAMSITWDSFWRTFSQYVGIHLGPANLVVAIFVGVHFATGARVLWPWAFERTIHFSCTYAAIPLVLLIAPATLTAINYFRLHHRRGRGWAALAIGCVIVASVFYVAAKEPASYVLGYLSLLSVVVVAPTGAFAINEITERTMFRWAGAVCSYVSLARGMFSRAGERLAVRNGV